MENLNKLMGERIAKLRKENHMTQTMLTEKLNISVRHCSAIECGNARLSIEKLIEVTDLFHVTLDYLIPGRRSSNKYIDLFPDSLIHSLQSGTDAELDLFKQYIQKSLNKKRKKHLAFFRFLLHMNYQNIYPATSASPLSP